MLGVSLLPLIALLVRGVGWGADSFAFYSVACGNTQYASNLSSNFFSGFLSLIGCNFVLTSFVQWFFYAIALFSLWEISKKVLGEHAWLLPVYVGTLTPLFFIEGLRFENDLFGWSLMLVALAVMYRGIQLKSPYRWLMLVLSSVIGLISYNAWSGSIILVPIAVILTDLKLRDKQIIIISLGIAFVLLNLGYILGSFNFDLATMVSEEIPLLGLVFILPILHYWNKIPQPFFIYGLGLLVLGCLKSKYMFLVTPFLVMALILKEKREGLWLKDLKIEPMLFVAIFSISFIIMPLNMYPTSSDIQEMELLISYYNDNNIPIYNDWGDGWTFIYLGYDTNYKSSPPQPDWNNLTPPFYV